MSNGEPIGMTCQSFSSVSLDPPLVLFVPGQDVARLAADPAGRPVLRQLPRRRPGRALQQDGQPRAPTSSPASTGSRPRPPARRCSTAPSATSTARIHTVHEAGDHFVVIGQVLDLHGQRRRGAAALLPGPVPHDRPLTVWQAPRVRSLEPAEDLAITLVRRFLLLCESPRTRRTMLRMVRGSTGNARAGRRFYRVVNRAVLSPVMRTSWGAGLRDEERADRLAADRHRGAAVRREGGADGVGHASTR